MLYTDTQRRIKLCGIKFGHGLVLELQDLSENQTKQAQIVLLTGRAPSSMKICVCRHQNPGFGVCCKENESEETDSKNV